MNCDEIRCLLESDARDAAEDAAVRRHLESCNDCAAYAGAMRAQDNLVKRALTQASDEVRFARVKRRLSEGIDRERNVGARWRWFAAAAGSIAASVLICAGIYFAARTSGPLDETRLNARDVFSQVDELQTKIRSTQVLDELVQLQAAMDGPEDQDGKSAAEDAELYIERILALHGTNEQAYRETLLGIGRSGVSARLRKVRESLTADAPKPVVASLDLAIATFDQAGQIVQAKEVACAD